MWGLLADIDLAISHRAQDLRLGPLSAFFVLASAWWFKGLLLASLGALADGLRRRAPWTAAWALAAALLGEITSALLKMVFERPRPPLADPALSAVGGLPGGYSFPSGHATAAFAAAAAVAYFYPRLRLPLFALAALVAASRVYLGVHFTSDVALGALLGLGLGLAVACLGRRLRLGPLERLFARLPGPRLSVPL